MDGHEGHNHPPMPEVDPAMFTKLMAEVAEAKRIDNLFLIPLDGPMRFVIAQVDEETGEVTTLGYIPFDFMLDVGIGFISAVRNAVKIGMPTVHEHESSLEEGEPPEDEGLAGGLFRVI